MLILSEEDIRACFGMADAIDAVAEAFESFSAGGAEVPLRTVLPIPGRDGNMIVMPGYVGGDAQRAAGTDSMGVKTLGFFEGNRRLGLPTIPATMLVMDAATGMPAALLNGTYLTQLRTAAAAGAATRLLARDDARTGALFGCGGQAACQLEALLATRDLDVVYVTDYFPEYAERFAERMSERFGGTYRTRIEASSDAEKIVRAADVITCVTTSNDPVFDASWVSDGCHVNGVGSYTPEMHELPEALLGRADRLLVDSRDAILGEDGEILDAIAHGTLAGIDRCDELGELVAGKVCGRTSPDEVTVFKTVGIAAEDVVCAARIVDAARNAGAGTEVAL